MKKLILVFSLVLSGCATNPPVNPDFPKAIPELMQKCKQLKEIADADKVPITEMLKTVVENYTMYYQCASKVDGWQEWYEKQKKNYENLK